MTHAATKNWTKNHRPVPDSSPTYAVSARLLPTGLKKLVPEPSLSVPDSCSVKFVKPFRFHLGGYIGAGKQWLSWISLEDQLEAIKFLMQNQNLSGPFNLTAPQPVTAKQFALSLAKILKTPAWLRAPAFVARMAIGQAARETLLASQKVVPKRLLDAGFEFKYPDIQSALTACGL